MYSMYAFAMYAPDSYTASVITLSLLIGQKNYTFICKNRIKRKDIQISIPICVEIIIILISLYRTANNLINEK